MNIDINCDLGEGLATDEAIMPNITSANVACGLHAGDALVMQKTIRLAKKFGVAVGAHPGWPDLAGFGRRELSFAADEVRAIVLYQIAALAAIAKDEHVELRHVKPHGALYNQAVADRALADSIALAVKDFNRDLILVGLAGSGLIEAGLQAGLRIAHEGFADRNYAADGTLISRSESNAVIAEPAEIAAHAVALATLGVEMGDRRVQIDTLCLHGDHPRATVNAAAVRAALEQAGTRVSAL